MYYILVRYGELTLKGKNRNVFERQLLKNIKSQLKEYGLTIHKDRNRIYIDEVSEEIVDDVRSYLQIIPGIHSFAVATVCDNDMDTIKDVALQVFDTNHPEFKVSVKRIWKGYDLLSNDIERQVGAHILINNDGLEGMKVKIKKPEQEVKIEIHEEKAYVFARHEMGMGGLPIGTAGRAIVLLSGGIDSPVAAIEAMKRGLRVDCFHFSSPPYTNEQAFEKVKDLTKQLQRFDKGIKLYDFHVADLQIALNRNCKDSLQVVLLRRMMMRVCEQHMDELGAGAIVTGENLAQVASQTLGNMNIVNSTIDRLILRPLLTYDKQGIIELAKKYDTYEISIRPFDDCCVLFLPKSPATNARLDKVLHEETRIDYKQMLEELKYDTFDYRDLYKQESVLGEYL